MEHTAKQRVLVVDDEPQVLVALEDLLGDEFLVSATGSPAQALEMARAQNDIAVVVSDQRMPEMSGDELLSELSSSSDATKILVTGFADLSAVIRAVNEGRIFAYVTKPWNPEDFRLKVKKAAEQFRLARELAKERHLMSAILHSLGEGIVVADADGKCLLFNPAAERLLGAGAHDLERERWAPEHGIFANDRATPLAPEQNPLFIAVEGKLAPELEVFINNPSSRSRAVAMSGTPLKDRKANLIGGIAVLRDVTATRELEAQLAQAQKLEAIGRLAGGVAHDFNNLLVVIQSYTELVKFELAEDDPKRADLVEVLGACQRAASLTKRLLAFSRRDVVRPIALQLSNVISGVENMLRRLIGEDVELQTSVSADLGFVRADAGQIEQVLLNLSVNARDAMPQGGQLTIECRNVRVEHEAIDEGAPVPPGEYVLLAVTDNGSGMDAETQARIFEPFFTTKEVGKGTGLGLATVYGVVQQSAGQIRVYSELGHGTSFKLYFPRLNSGIEPVVKVEQVEVIAPQILGTVLLVEDEDAVRQVAARVLRAKGHSVLEASRPSDARELCKQAEHIDLLLTDVVMPELSGTELARELRRQQPGMRVLYMSGYPDAAAARSGAIEPGSPYLEKPFSPSLLLQKVQAALSI
ncbi:MAG TPA: response regulator [Polyangiaceae bacterium]|jgi:PAS domain S-box-containing protein|nr:response regulator [Polyangiaceae bacterium]